MGLVPFAEPTVTSTTVPALPAGAVALTWLSELTVKAVAVTAPNRTTVAPVKLAPLTVTAVPPVAGPLLGLTPVTEGAAGVAVYEKVSADVLALVPAGVVTVTSTVPVPAGDVAVIDVGEATVKPAFAAPNLTAVAPPKLLPEIVTAVPPAGGPLLGLTALTEGGVVVPPQLTTTGVEAAWALVTLALETN